MIEELDIRCVLNSLARTVMTLLSRARGLKSIRILTTQSTNAPFGIFFCIKVQAIRDLFGLSYQSESRERGYKLSEFRRFPHFP